MRAASSASSAASDDGADDDVPALFFMYVPAEAELYCIVKATAELKGLMSLWKDLGVVLSCHLLADASAALGILKGAGSGK